MSEEANVFTLTSWETFEVKRAEIINPIEENRSPYRSSPTILYRGLSDNNYALSTTLERAYEGDSIPYVYYFDLIHRVKPQIETFLDKSWTLEHRDAFSTKVGKVDAYMANRWDMDAYSFMVYLRHHGFPSPLLDWTRSPYVAAYFAFKSAQKPSSGFVSIYGYCEYVDGGKGGFVGHPTIEGYGPYIKSHKRHFLQQGEYTVCSEFINGAWHFVSHDKVLSQKDTNQDVWWRFDIPWTERTKVLSTLDKLYNINAYSLFNSEESLMETMALRELSQ